MYQPEQHREDRLDVQHDLIETHPFGLLISHDSEGLQANGLPFLCNVATDRSAGCRPISPAPIRSGASLTRPEVLVVFQGPLNYVTPAFYETKRETGKVVPTWNYAMVQARGTARVRADTELARHADRRPDRPARGGQARTMARLRRAAPLYRGAIARHRRDRDRRSAASKAKWNVSQNRPEGDRKGVAAGLADAHPEMAALVRRYGKIGDDA